MTTITSRQREVLCDLAVPGSTADEVIKAQDRHLKEAVAARDQTHQSARKDRMGRWRRPIAGLGWSLQVKA